MTPSPGDDFDDARPRGVGWAEFADCPEHRVALVFGGERGPVRLSLSLADAVQLGEWLYGVLEPVVRGIEAGLARRN